MSQRQASFGYGTKSDFTMKRENGPDAGLYNLPSDFDKYRPKS